MFEVNKKRVRETEVHESVSGIRLTNRSVAALNIQYHSTVSDYRRFGAAGGACLRQRQTRSVCLMNGKPDGLCCRLR